MCFHWKLWKLENRAKCKGSFRMKWVLGIMGYCIEWLFAVQVLNVCEARVGENLIMGFLWCRNESLLALLVSEINYKVRV